MAEGDAELSDFIAFDPESYDDPQPESLLSFDAGRTTVSAELPPG